EYTAIPVIDGFWNWFRTYNTGAAFSFLADGSGWQQYLFAGLAVAISAVLAWWLAKTPRGDWRTALPFALVIGGAIGNLVDRLMHGHVVDFIQWYWRDHYWPAFNVADAAIVGGAVGIALFGLLGSGKDRARTGSRGSTARHGHRPRQSPGLLRGRRPRDRDREAGPGQPRRADLRAPRGRAQPLRRRRAQAPRRGVRGGAARGAGR